MNATVFDMLEDTKTNLEIEIEQLEDELLEGVDSILINYIAELKKLLQDVKDTLYSHEAVENAYEAMGKYYEEKFTQEELNGITTN